MKKAISTISFIIIVITLGATLNGCNNRNSRETNHPFKPKENKDLLNHLYITLEHPLFQLRIDSLINIKSDTGVISFKSELNFFQSGFPLYSLDTTNTLEGLSRIYVYEDGRLDSIIIHHKSGKVFENVLYASQKLIVTTVGAPQGFIMSRETGEPSYGLPTEVYLQHIDKNLNLSTELFITDKYFDGDRQNPNSNKDYLFNNLPEFNDLEQLTNIDNSKIIDYAVYHGGEYFYDRESNSYKKQPYNIRNLVLEKATDSVLVFRTLDYNYLTGEDFRKRKNISMEFAWNASAPAWIERFPEDISTTDIILEYPQGASNMKAYENQHLKETETEIDLTVDVKVYQASIIDRYKSWVSWKEREREKRRQQINDNSNNSNKSSTSNNIDGWYSYEDQTSTYRLTVSNGRWSYSTAIKISGVAQTDQSSGIERNGVLYMGGASVGNVDGNCAQVGSSPQMCKP